MGLLSGLGLVGAEVVSASAAIIWGHPFTSYSGRSRGFTGQWPEGHAGTDYTPGAGTPIYAVADGYVTGSYYHANYGEAVFISHGDGWSSIYAHMQPNTRTSANRNISRGDFVGRVGDTGKSFGAHLHIEIQRNGFAYNPDLFIDRTAPLAGQNPSGGDMALTDADKQWLNGLGASIIQQVIAGVPAAVWNHPIAAQDRNGNNLNKTFPASGYMSSTNAGVNALRQDLT